MLLSDRHAWEYATVTWGWGSCGLMVDLGNSAAYNRSDYFEQRVKMMQWWSDHIEQASQGNISLAVGHRGLRMMGE